MKLSDMLKGEQQQNTTSDEKVIWNVTILDCSGSMSSRGSYTDTKTKIEAAIEGIQLDIKAMREDTTGVKFKVAIVEFEGDYGGANHHYRYKVPFCDLDKVVYGGSGTGGNTPLYATLGDVIDDIIKLKPKDHPCVVSVFTDGGENSSRSSKYANAAVLKERIDSAEKENISVKFIGTQHDVESMIRNVGVKAHNTYFHDNSSVGMAASFQARTKGVSNYTKSFAAGASADELTRSVNFFTEPKDPTNKESKSKKDETKK